VFVGKRTVCVPEPEYSVKGVRFRYDKPRSGT